MNSVLQVTFILLTLGVAAGCATTQEATDMRAGAVRNAELIEIQLTKGVSTKADVERLLGKPIGDGAALSGLDPERPRELWVYGEAAWSLIGFEGGVARTHFEQQLLMVYFLDGKFDGYWWNSNAGPIKVK